MKQKTSFTLHVRKDLGNGRAVCRMLQNGRIWQQTFSAIAGAGEMLQAGWYTMDTAKMAEFYENDGWQIVSQSNCVTI